MSFPKADYVTNVNEMIARFFGEVTENVSDGSFFHIVSDAAIGFYEYASQKIKDICEYKVFQDEYISYLFPIVLVLMYLIVSIYCQNNEENFEDQDEFEDQMTNSKANRLSDAIYQSGSLSRVKVQRYTSTVLHITEPSDFKFILQFHIHVLVMFYLPWCTLCAETIPQFYEAGANIRRNFEKLSSSKQLKHLPVLMLVNSREHHQLSVEFGIFKYPRILYFFKGKLSLIYNEQFNADSLVAFMDEISHKKPLVNTH